MYFFFQVVRITSNTEQCQVKKEIGDSVPHAAVFQNKLALFLSFKLLQYSDVFQIKIFLV